MSIAEEIQLKKAAQAILYWISRCGGDSLVDLNKYFYFLDFAKTKLTGKPFSNVAASVESGSGFSSNRLATR